MTAKRKKVFGIDINKTAVSFAELQKDGSQIKVLRSGTLPIEGIVDNCVVRNPATLADLLKKSEIGGLFRHSDAAITICAEPVLLQILDISNAAPSEVKKTIQNEVRQYAVLPLKNIVMDYCGLRSPDAETKRVLVGAGQSEYLIKTVRILGKNNINVQAVEPAVTAFIRACFNKAIRPAGKKNVMLLLVRGDNLNLCVFEKQRLEFLRTKKFESDIAASQQRDKWLRDEIESVLRFYEIERESGAQSWQIIIAACPDNSISVRIADEIKSRIIRQDIEIIPFDSSMLDAAIDAEGDKEISPVAAGAAMKLLDEGTSGIRLNLLPDEILADRKAEKETLVIANIAAGLLIVAFVLVAFLGRKTLSAGSNIHALNQKQAGTEMLTLSKSKRQIDEKIRVIEQDSAVLEKAARDRKCYNWARLLVELAKACPRTILMDSLESKTDDTMKINGLAVNYESANEFVNILEQSKKIETASLISAGQSEKFNGLIDYSILCSLVK